MHFSAILRSDTMIKKGILTAAHLGGRGAVRQDTLRGDPVMDNVVTEVRPP
jgi:hypothetical protein